MLMEFSVMPVGKKTSVAEEIAELVPLMDSSRLRYQMNAMSTVVEGEWDELCSLAKECHAKVRDKHPRVVTTIRFDDEEGAEGEIAGNIEAVESALKR